MWFVVLPGPAVRDARACSARCGSRRSASARSGSGRPGSSRPRCEAVASPVVGRVSDRRGRIAPILAGLVASAIVLRLLPVARPAVRAGRADRRRRRSRSASSGRPRCRCSPTRPRRAGLDYAYGFALMNMAWAPGQFSGRGARRRARGRDGRRRARTSAPRACACLRLPFLRRHHALPLPRIPHDDPQAPRGEPRRDRRARLPHLPRARDRDRRRGRARRPRRAARARGRRDRRRSRRTSTPRSTSAPRSARAPTRSTPATGSSPRTPTSRRPSTRPGSSSSARRPEALRAGGDKLAAKRIAREAGVPVVESGEPETVGFPLIIKAAAGGGGRGMRVVRDPAELADALEAAEREAEAAFGDGTVFCERYVERPRHVEIQLLGDSHGTVVALGERECSVQRRHQKVLEESPSPALDPALRAAMSDAAVAFARGDRLLERGHRGVHARRPRLLLPRAERPDPGRAPGHRARHRRRPRPRADPGRRGRARSTMQPVSCAATPSRCGCTPRIRGRSSRRPGRSSGCGCRPGSASTRASPKATRSASPTTR